MTPHITRTVVDKKREDDVHRTTTIDYMSNANVGGIRVNQLRGKYEDNPIDFTLRVHRDAGRPDNGAILMELTREAVFDLVRDLLEGVALHDKLRRTYEPD